MLPMLKDAALTFSLWCLNAVAFSFRVLAQMFPVTICVALVCGVKCVCNGVTHSLQGISHTHAATAGGS